MFEQHGLAYLKALIQSKQEGLRSSDCCNKLHVCVHVPKTSRKTFGERAFSVAGPHIWNTLHNYIIHPCDPRLVICYLIWPCDIAFHITYLVSHSSSLSYNIVIKGYFSLGV